MQSIVDYQALFQTWTKILPQLNPPLPSPDPALNQAENCLKSQGAGLHNAFTQFLGYLKPFAGALATSESNSHLYYFHSTSPPEVQSATKQFLRTLLDSIFQQAGREGRIDFSYMYDVGTVNPPPLPPTPAHPLSIFQFNMLADHLSGSHPQFGNFEGIDIKSLSMLAYRQWKLLDLLVRENSFIAPSNPQNGHTNNHYNNPIQKDIITIEELDSSFYHTFFGPILALLGYHSSYSPKHTAPTGLNDNGKPTKSCVNRDGTGIFSRFPIQFRQNFVLSLSQVAVAILVNVAKSSGIAGVNRQSELSDATVEARYVLVIATHLKADKSADGEIIRHNQINNLYSHIGSMVGSIIDTHVESLTLHLDAKARNNTNSNTDQIGVESSKPFHRLRSEIASLANIAPQLHPIIYPGLLKKTLSAENDPESREGPNYNLSVIVCGDFNAAPYESTITPYPPLTYEAAKNNRIHLNLKPSGHTNPVAGAGDFFDHRIQHAISFESVYSHYNHFYQNYIDQIEQQTSFTTHIDLGHRDDTIFSSIEPPPSHLPGLPDSVVPYPEAPYTTMKTRSSMLFKHTIDYILYNAPPPDAAAAAAMLTRPTLLALGALPNSATALPSYGLPDWIFPSDHLPLMALFDLE